MSQQFFKGEKVEHLYHTAKHDATIFSPDHELCAHLLVPWKGGTTNRELNSLITKKDVMSMKQILLQVAQMISSVNHLIPLAANSSLTLRR